MIEARPLLRLSTRLLAPLALCLAAAPPSLGQGSGTSGNGNNPPAFRETGLGPLPRLSHTGPGAEFLHFGTTTRTAGIVTPTQVCPFNIAGTALPIGAQVVASLITWNYLLDGPAPLSDSILVNGSVVVGELVASGSPGLCWGKQGVATYVAWHVLPPFQIGSPVNSFDQLCDKPLGTDPNALGEGVSVLVVYEVTGQPQRTVDVWLGYTSTSSNPLGSALSDLLFSATYLGGETHFGLVTLDGQQSQDEFLLNGQPTAGLLNGLHVQGDAWAGLVGPLPIDNLFDAINDDIQPFLSPGDTQLTTNTISLGDCSAHTLAALAYSGSPLCRPAVYCAPKPSSLGCMPRMTTSGPGGAFLCPVSGADDYDVIVTGVNTFRMGLVFYSPFGRSNMPFHGGLLCVQGPLLRTPLQPTGGINANTCAGSLTLRLNDPTDRVDQPPGTTLWLQGWFRDAAASFGEGLSNGLEVTFQ